MTTQQLASGQLVLSAAVASARALGMPIEFARLAGAQAELESAWGLRNSGAHNVLGITRDGYLGENFIGVRTHEANSAGALVPVEREFQNYNSLEECFSDHARIFQSGPLQQKYTRWLSSGGPGDAIELLHYISYPSEPPLYATDHNYFEDVAAILSMSEFDKMFTIACA